VVSAQDNKPASIADLKALGELQSFTRARTSIDEIAQQDDPSRASSTGSGIAAQFE
jgi:hypothetical protein